MCEPCAGGSFSAHKNSSVCVKCDRGSYAAGVSNTECQVCSAGSVASATGASAAAVPSTPAEGVDFDDEELVLLEGWGRDSPPGPARET